MSKIRQNPWQPSLAHVSVAMYAPTTTTEAAGGQCIGRAWNVGSSTITTTVPNNSSKNSQMKRTFFANVVTTQNQRMGVQFDAADDMVFWRGDAVGLGGFYFSATFSVSAWPADTCRLFAGLCASTTGVVISDTVLNDTVGLWHDTTDGANVLSIVTKATGSATKTAITGATLAAGNGFVWEMWAYPNDSVIWYKLTSVNTGNVIAASSVSATLPTASTFMGPQVALSNGTANITANTVTLGLARIYVETAY